MEKINKYQNAKIYKIIDIGYNIHSKIIIL